MHLLCKQSCKHIHLLQNNIKNKGGEGVHINYSFPLVCGLWSSREDGDATTAGLKEEIRARKEKSLCGREKMDCGLGKWKGKKLLEPHCF